MNPTASNIDRSALRMLLGLARQYPGRSLLALLALVLAGLLDGLGLSLLLSMLNLATGTSDDPSLPEQLALDFTAAVGLSPTTSVLLSLGVGMILIKAIIMLLANRQVGYTVAHVATDLRLNLIQSVMNSHWRYYLGQPVGRLSNAVATEAHRASEGFYHGAVMATQLINALIYGVLAVLISWQAALGALLLGTLLLGLLHLLVTSAGRAGQRQTQLLKSLLAVMTDQLGAIKPLKAMGREQHVDALMAGQTRQLKQALKNQVFARAALVALQEPMLAILVALGFFGLLTVMGLPMATVVILIFLIARAVNHLAKAQRAYQHLAISESAYWSLRETIGEADDQREQELGQLEPILQHAIRFEQVSFAYGAQGLIKGLNLELPAGTLTVIIGPSGAGKTTLIDLVVGLLQPDQGQITVDGRPLHEINQRQWRQRIGYVPQDPLLTNDSVLHNLTLGQTELTEADAQRALQQANAWDFVSALPQGLHTALGERGGRLSGGQRQRLAIARALIHQPQLLILDEATSSLDSAAEQVLVETIAKLKGQLTMLAVTHDDSLLAIADQCIRLHEGQRQ